MNSKFNLIFVCLIINLIVNVFNVLAVDTDFDDLAYTEDEIVEYAIDEGIWTRGQINFKLDKRFNKYEIGIILGAMHEIEISSCVRFAAHNPSYGPDYVMIKKVYDNRSGRFPPDLGCRHRGEQLLKIAADSTNDRQMILYKIVCAVGIDYHHKRLDRTHYYGLSDHDKHLLNQFYGCGSAKKRKSRLFHAKDNAHVSINNREVERAQNHFDIVPVEGKYIDEFLANNDDGDEAIGEVSAQLV